MQTTSDTISGVLTEVRYQDTDSQWGIYRVKNCDGSTFEASGRYPSPHLFEQVNLTGSWVDSPDSMPELAFYDLIAKPPEDLEYLSTYLHRLLDISPKDGVTLVKTYGSETTTVLDSSPDKLARCQLQSVSHDEIRHRWLKLRGFDQIKNQAQLKGIPDSALSRVVNHLGASADLQLALREDPYLIYRVCNDLSFSTVRKFASYFNCAPDSASAVKGSIVAALRGSLNVRGTKHLTTEQLAQMVRSPKFLNIPELESSVIQVHIDEMNGSELYVDGDIIQLQSVYKTQKALAGKLLSFASNPSEIAPEAKESGFETHLTIADYDTLDQLLSWLDEVIGRAADTGAHILVITANSELSAYLDDRADCSVGDYMDILRPFTESTAELNGDNPLPADVVVIAGAHLMPDAALLMISEATTSGTALIIAGNPNQLDAPTINSSYAALSQIEHAGHTLLGSSNHWAKISHLPSDCTTFDLDSEISWLSCKDDELVESVRGLIVLFTEQLNMRARDINIICLSRYLDNKDLVDEVFSELKSFSGELTSNTEMLPGPLWDKGLIPYAKYDPDILASLGKKTFKGDCAPLSMSLNTFGRLTIVLAPSSQTSILNRESFLFMRDTCSENLIVLGDIVGASSRWTERPTRYDTHYKNLIGKLNEISVI